MPIMDESIDIQNKDMYQRSDFVAFMGVEGSGSEKLYARMKGFTQLGQSKSTKEYTRQYVDENFERTTAIGMTSSIGYNFDRYTGNTVLTKLAAIADKELIGEDATVDIIMVDMKSINQSTSGNYTAAAYKRQYSVMPTSAGDSTDAMTYAGDFKACGDISEVTVAGTSANPKKWLSCVETEASGASLDDGE